MKRHRLVFILTLALVLTGCAKPRGIDPMQGLNRATFAFNKALDRVILKPSAQMYEALVPKPIQYMVSNFFQNIGEIPTVANNVLQADFPRARYNCARFIINTTWGIGGLVDIAEGRGKMKKDRSDFGITLAKWGYKESIYFVMPIFGPSTLRDMYGRVATYYMGVWPWIRSRSLSNGLFVLNLIDLRSNYLKIEPLMNQSIDDYIFIRDAYLQRRKYEIEGKLEPMPAEATQADTNDELLEGPPE